MSEELPDYWDDSSGPFLLAIVAIALISYGLGFVTCVLL